MIMNKYKYTDYQRSYAPLYGLSTLDQKICRSPEAKSIVLCKY